MSRKFTAYVSGTGWLCAETDHDVAVHGNSWTPVVQLTQEQCKEIREFLGPSVDEVE